MGLLTSIIIGAVAAEQVKDVLHTAGDIAGNLINAKENADSGVNICPSRAEADYCGNYAIDVAKELLGCGFKKVTLRPMKSLGRFSASQYGTVYHVSIGGNLDFKKKDVFPVTSYIVVTYQDFKDNVDRSVYNKIRCDRITPGEMTYD